MKYSNINLLTNYFSAWQVAKYKYGLCFLADISDISELCFTAEITGVPRGRGKSRPGYFAKWRPLNKGWDHDSMGTDEEIMEFNSLEEIKERIEYGQVPKGSHYIVNRFLGMYADKCGRMVMRFTAENLQSSDLYVRISPKLPK